MLSLTYGSTLTSVHDYWKIIALIIQIFIGKVMSCFLMLFSFVIAFLPRSKRLLISRLQPLSAVILEPKKIKSANVFTFSLSLFHEVSSSLAQTLPMHFRKHNYFSLTSKWLWQTQDRSSQTHSPLPPPSLFIFSFLMVPSDLVLLWIPATGLKRPMSSRPFLLWAI